MRRIRYSVAMSLDGYVAGPNGEFDWIVMDPQIDFAALMDQFDTLVMGRKTFETTQSMGDAGTPKLKTVVVSRTLRGEDHPGVTIIRDNLRANIEELRAEPGKDIWLFGGGDLFRSLLAENLVDTVEVAVIPVLLGGGIPLLPEGGERAKLKLTKTHVYKKSGIVALDYAVEK